MERSLTRYGAGFSAELDAYDVLVWRELGPGLRNSYRLQRLVTHRVSGRVIESLMTQAARRPEVRDTVVRIVRRLLSPGRAAQ